MTLTAIGIRFHNGRVIQIENAFAYADNYSGNGYARVSEVIWQDGSYSYAKCWYDARYNYRMVKIGAGAYGDMDILNREFQGPVK